MPNKFKYFRIVAARHLDLVDMKKNKFVLVDRIIKSSEPR